MARPRKTPDEVIEVGVIATSFGWGDRKYLRGETLEMSWSDMVRFPRQVMIAEAAANYIAQEDAG